MKTPVIIGILALVVIAGGGLFLMNMNRSASPTPTPGQEETKATNPTTAATENPESTGGAMMEKKTNETAPQGTLKEFVVSGRNFAFDPKELRVSEGDTVKITFKNAGGFHDFVIDEFDVATKQINNGQEASVEFTANKKGSFEYYCSVGNHRAQGMVGKLIVE